MTTLNTGLDRSRKKIMKPYITKTITTGHDVSASCWAIDGAPAISEEGASFTLRGVISLWKDVNAREASKTILDRCYFSITIPASDLLSGTTAAVLNYIVNNAVTLESGHSGPIDFGSGATVVIP